MKRIYLTVVLLLSLSQWSWAGEEFDHKHEEWGKVLKTYVVVNGPLSSVKYGELRKQAQEFRAYLKRLSAATKTQYEAWTESQKIAFLINAYNAFTVKLITDNYPVKSIKSLGGLFSSPWKKKFFSLLGEDRHLDHIEHEMLRKQFKEPRIHFALNCASIGCPMLLNEPYVADKLNAQLDAQARLFLRDKNRNRIINDRLEISKIFDWFEEDFKAHSGSVAAYVAPYMTDDEAEKIRIATGQITIRHTDFDWSLNATQ